MGDFRKKHNVYLGLPGFPVGMAAIQRQKLLAKALVKDDWKVTVICSRSTHNANVNVKRVGRHEGIIYIYLYSPFRKKNFIIRNSQKIFAPLLELILLIKLKKKSGIDVGIVTNRNSFIDSAKYFIFSKLLQFNLVINLVEIYQDRLNTTLSNKFNDYLFNKFGLLFYDAYLPISNNIIDYFSKSEKKHHMIPVIVDVGLFDKINVSKSEEPFFLFCGSASYFNSIKFILESFSLINEKQCKLVLVTNGSAQELENISTIIKQNNLVDKVVIMKNLTDLGLYTLYKSAAGLLLPLFDTIQDKARFPHKLAEYLASGTIVISNPIGEITNYLDDFKNILFSETNDPHEYARKMNWILNNKQEALTIGLNGYNVSKQYFDYNKLSDGTSKFLKNLTK